MEAQFLQAQQQRLLALKKQRRGDLSIARRTALENSLEQLWSKWKDQLSAVEAMTEPPSQEEDRRQLQLRLNQLKDGLNDLRHQAVVAPTRDNENDSLSDATLQRWYRVLVTGQGLLDQLQARLLPKGKFVFRRYRQAMMEAQQKQRDGDRTPYVPHENTESVLQDSQTSDDDNGDLVHALQEFSNGSFRIFGTRIEFQSLEDASRQQVNLEGDDDDTFPLVWRRLNQCKVEWMPDKADSDAVAIRGGAVLHLVDIADCELRIHVALRSVHVTDCRGLVLHLASVQQVRLHTSANVEVWGRVQGGTILEDCVGIGVTTNCPSVQDFSWLQAGKPSPNLERLCETLEDSSTRTAPCSNRNEQESSFSEIEGSLPDRRSPGTSVPSPIAGNPDSGNKGKDEDDSDDEL